MRLKHKAQHASAVVLWKLQQTARRESARSQSNQRTDSNSGFHARSGVLMNAICVKQIVGANFTNLWVRRHKTKKNLASKTLMENALNRPKQAFFQPRFE